MKPAWDKLMRVWNKGDRFKNSLIADVDCTSDIGKPLCEKVGVEGFPTIKWGEASSMEDYDGGRDFDALRKFAKENLKPRCGPANIDLCDEETKKEIAALQLLGPKDLAHQIDQLKASVKTIEMFFNEEVKEIQDEKAQLKEDKDETQIQKLKDRYAQLQTKKDETIDKLKESGLTLMLAVAAHKAKRGQQEL